jgi:hypothetical protein
MHYVKDPSPPTNDRKETSPPQPIAAINPKVEEKKVEVKSEEDGQVWDYVSGDS